MGPCFIFTSNKIAVKWSPGACFDITRWKLTGMFCLFLCCCWIFCTSQLFLTFAAFSTFSLASHLHCPWVCRWLSNTSKGKVCVAADNALYPQAPASFFNWQVWPLLHLVGNSFFADVASVCFFSSWPFWLQSPLFSRATSLNVHLHCRLAAFLCSCETWQDEGSQ